MQPLDISTTSATDTIEAAESASNSQSASPDEVQVLIGSLYNFYDASESSLKDITTEMTDNLEQIDALSQSISAYKSIVDGQDVLGAMGSDPLFVSYCEGKNISPTDASSLTSYINAPQSEGGLGIAFNGDPVTDTSWINTAIDTQESKIDSLQSINQITMLEMQQVTNQLNLIVTTISSIIKSYGDAKLGVANKS